MDSRNGDMRRVGGSFPRKNAGSQDCRREMPDFFKPMLPTTRERGSADLFCKVRGSSPDNSKKPRTYRTGPPYQIVYRFPAEEAVEAPSPEGL